MTAFNPIPPQEAINLIEAAGSALASACTTSSRSRLAADMRTVVHERWHREEREQRDRRRQDTVRAAPRRIDRREPDPRRALARAVAANGRTDVTFASLSRMIDRPDGYLARFVSEGTPLALQPEEHRRLAGFFGLDERGLGVRDLWLPR